MFGVNSASEIFQRVLENMLAGCPNCLNYLDFMKSVEKVEKEQDFCLQKVLDVFKQCVLKRL